MDAIRAAIEWAAVGIDILAVVMIVAAVAVATVLRGPIRALFRVGRPGAESRYKRQVGNGLLTGLDLLVASDVIRTVALETTLVNVGTLGMLVVVRVLLTWSLVVELEGRWPWQPGREPTTRAQPGPRTTDRHETSTVTTGAMSEMFGRVWADFVGRIDGPLHFRVIVQPLVACVLAARAGLSDARQRKPPYLWGLAFEPSQRRDLARGGWKDIGTVFVVGVVLDVIYQLIALRWVYPTEAVLAAILLVVVPYLLVRGPVTFLARKD